MQYLFDTDFLTQLRSTDFADLTAENPEALAQMEAQALSSAGMVLSAAFDTTALLAPWRAYDEADTYLPGERVRTPAGGLYVCHTAAPAATALTDSGYFTSGDARPAELVQALVALVTYGLHLRWLPAAMPAERRKADGDALTLLQDLASGRLPAPGWPLAEGRNLRILSGGSESKGWL